jgi:hypothetical protein
MDCGSAYQIQNGLKTKNTARIANKIDIDGVHVSLRPTVEHEIENSVSEALAKAGPAAAVLRPKLKQQMMPQLVDHDLATLVTPEIMIRIYREGCNCKSTAPVGLVRPLRRGRSRTDEGCDFVRSAPELPCGGRHLHILKGSLLDLAGPGG